MKSSRIGIVCSGGGMTSAYSAGALTALYIHHQITEPRLLIGASGSAGNCAYFAAKQPDFGKSIWCEYLTNGQLISWRRWPILDINYLVNKVFRKQFPLAIGVIKTSPTQFLTPVRDKNTGRLHYLSSHDPEADIFENLLAAKHVPLLTGHHGRSQRHYVDGDIPKRLDLHIATARSYNCDTLIVIDNSQSSSYFIRCLIWIYSCFVKGGYRAALRNQLFNPPEPITPAKDLILIRPSQPLNMGVLTDSKSKVERAYNLGYQDALHHPELKTLFNATER